jgi:hypothetical protein
MWKYFRFLVWKEEGVPPAQAQSTIRLNRAYRYFLEMVSLLHTSFYYLLCHLHNLHHYNHRQHNHFCHYHKHNLKNLHHLHNPNISVTHISITNLIMPHFQYQLQ